MKKDGSVELAVKVDEERDSGHVQDGTAPSSYYREASPSGSSRRRETCCNSCIKFRLIIGKRAVVFVVRFTYSP